MAMEMRLFRDLRPRTRYQKLLRDVDFDEEKSCYAMRTPTRKRCFWVKKLNGKLIRGLKISRSKKRFSWLLNPRKIARIYNEVVKRLIELDGSNIIFSTTWGLPVLSHSSSARRSLSYV